MKPLALALSLFLAIAACGGSGESEREASPSASASATPEKPRGGYGTYVVETPEGGKVTLTLDKPGSALPDDDLIARAEKMRSAAGVAAVQWVPVTVDNRDGSEEVWVDYGFEVVTESGQSFESEVASQAVETWAGEINDPTLTDDLVNAWLRASDEDVAPGALSRGYIVLDVPDGPPARVFYNGIPATLQD